MVKAFVITCDHDQSAPETLSPRLKNAIDGLAKMVRSEGALSLFPGSGTELCAPRADDECAARARHV